MRDVGPATAAEAQVSILVAATAAVPSLHLVLLACARPSPSLHPHLAVLFDLHSNRLAEGLHAREGQQPR